MSILENAAAQGGETKECIICGVKIEYPKSKYCSVKCNNRAKNIKRRIPEDVKTENRNARRLGRLKEDSFNRPYTEDTAFLIRKWHSEGMRLELICAVLQRSKNNIMKAFYNSRPHSAAKTAQRAAGA